MVVFVESNGSIRSARSRVIITETDIQPFVIWQKYSPFLTKITFLSGFILLLAGTFGDFY